MNNQEKQTAKILKDKGFHVFWFHSGPFASGYYATHPKLTSQYCIATCADLALQDISNCVLSVRATILSKKKE